MVRVPGFDLVVESGRVRGGGGGGGGVTFIFVLEPRFRRFYELILHYVCHALHFHINK